MAINSKVAYFFVFWLYVLNFVYSCPPITPQKGVNLECKLSNGTILDCGSNEIPKDTIAKFSCGKYFIRDKSPRQGELLCSEDGEWEYLSDYEDFHCKIDCGNTRLITPAIVSGSEADKLDFPWHASIFLRNPKNDLFELICGGSLINLNDKGPLILTAAHCLSRSPNIKHYRIILGAISSSFLKNKDNDTQIFGVSYLAKHPSYNPINLDNDIGIMKLKGDIELSDAVKPICLERDAPQPKSGDMGMIAGFGTTKMGNVSEKLLYVSLPVRSRLDCLEEMPDISKFEFPDTKFCAGFTHRDNAIHESSGILAAKEPGNQTRSGICSGDSGGGFAVLNSIKKRSTLVGIAHGALKDLNLECSGFGYFQSVQKYIWWIRETQKSLYPTTSVDEGVDAKRCGSDPESDWVEYKDEKCFRLVNQLVTKAEASKICEYEPGNSLPILKSSKEHEFLLKFLEDNKISNGVWLGSARGPSGFHWDNGDRMGNFSKWESWNFGEKNCSKLKQSTGFWVEEDCGAANLVVCEKMQDFSNTDLLKNFFNLKSNFEEFKKGTQIQFEKQQKELEDKSKELSLANLESLLMMTNLVESLNAKLDNIIPVGFMYFQVGTQPSPKELWPKFNWKDISSNYSGLFFRVTGGGAAPIGKVQCENSPRLGSVEFFTSVQSSISNKITIGSDGDHPFYLNNQNYDPESKYRDGYKFRMANPGEVRPKNTAMKVWIRI